MSESLKDRLVDHEQKLLVLGRLMARSTPDNVLWDKLGTAIADVVNGLPTVRDGITTLGLPWPEAKERFETNDV